MSLETIAVIFERNIMTPGLGHDSSVPVLLAMRLIQTPMLFSMNLI